MKKDAIGNRTRDLSACGAVSQPTAPPRVPVLQDTLSGIPIKVICFHIRFPGFIFREQTSLRFACIRVGDL